MSTRRSVKPRVIRHVYLKDRRGRVKIARDRRAQLQMERVKARTPKPCRFYACTSHGIIDVGEEYAKVTYLDKSKRIGVLYIPLVYDYHFGCTPPVAWPLLRFFGEPKPVSRNEPSQAS